VPKKEFRELPREYPQGPWPLLHVRPEDRQYTPIPETLMARRWRLARASLDLLALDLGLASFKGAMFGLFSFALIFSFVTLRVSGFCWLVGWHWAFATGAIILSLLLIGFDYTLLIILAVALWLSFRTMITHPILLLLFIGGGVLLRWILELLPQRIPLASNKSGRRRERVKQKRAIYRVTDEQSSTSGGDDET
jgi:hypothetical protein